MDEIILEVAKLGVMLITFVVGAYLLPYINQKIGTEKTSQLEAFVKDAVYATQQLLSEKTGTERREYATKLITEWCETNSIPFDDDEVRVLIEAAVKGMKIAEGATNEDK